MPVVVDSTVGSGVGRDYPTWADWESAAPADLVVSDTLWAGKFYFDGDTRLTVTGSCLLSGSTGADATRRKYARAAPGESWVEKLGSNPIGGIPDGAGFSVSGNPSAALGVSEPFGVIERLVWNAGTAASARWSSIASAAADSVIRECYLRKAGTTSASTALTAIAGPRSVYAQNVHVYMGTSSLEEYFEFGSAASSEADAPVFIANGLVVTSTDSTGAAAAARGTAIRMNASTSARYTRVIGNYFAGVAVLFEAGGVGQFTSDSGYNLVTLAQGASNYSDRFPGSGNKYAGDISGTWSGANALLVDTTYAGLDVRAAEAGALAGAGIRITAPPNPSATFVGCPWVQRDGLGDVDVLGNSRSSISPFIGPHEPRSSSGAALAAAAFYHRYMRS